MTFAAGCPEGGGLSAEVHAGECDRRHELRHAGPGVVATPANATVGTSFDMQGLASSPAAIRLFQRLRKLPVMSMPLTGRTILPPLKRKPSIPYEKSPVAWLQLPPLKSVTRIPSPQSPSRSSQVIPALGQGISRGLVADSIVGAIPSLRDM